MNPNQTIRCASAIVIAAALGAGALTAAKADDVVQVMRHSTPALPGYGTLMLEIWTDGTAVQVIGLDGEGPGTQRRTGALDRSGTDTPGARAQHPHPDPDAQDASAAHLMRERCTSETALPCCPCGRALKGFPSGIWANSWMKNHFL